MLATEFSRKIGKTIKARRTELLLTQKQLAEEAGVSERSVISLEMGASPGVRIDKLISVLDALGLVLSVTDAADSTKVSNTVLAVHKSKPNPHDIEYQKAFDSALKKADDKFSGFLKRAYKRASHE